MAHLHSERWYAKIQGYVCKGSGQNEEKEEADEDEDREEGKT